MPIEQVPFDAQFVVVDLLDAFEVSGGASAAGVATAQFEPTGSRYWRIGHAAVQLAPLSGSALKLYVGEALTQNLLDGTLAGDFDVGDWSWPLIVPPSSYLRAVWTGCAPGAEGTIHVQGELVELRQVERGR